MNSGLRVLRTRLLVTCFAVTGFAAPGYATEADLVIQRNAGSVELYFSVPADALVTVFGMDPALLEEPDGTVDFESLRMGTWDIGDAAFEHVEAQIDGEAATFEAMSLMVHPMSSVLPLEDPIDGMVAIAVCSVPAPATPPTLADLRAYVGYIAYTDRPLGDVSLKFPSTGRDELEVNVRDFVDFRFINAQTLVVADDETLSVSSVQADRSRGPNLAMLAAVLLASVTVFFVGRRALRARGDGPGATV